MIERLLDTNIVSELLSHAPNQTVSDRFDEHAASAAIGAPTWFELLFGLARLPHSRRRTEVERALRELHNAGIPILPYDSASAEWHAEERARLMALGQTPSFVDGQLAAIAAANGLIVVTRNVRDFASYTSLVIENWFE